MYVIFPVDKILDIESVERPERASVTPATTIFFPHYAQCNTELKRGEGTGDSHQSAGNKQVVSDTEIKAQVKQININDTPTSVNRNIPKVLKQQVLKTSEVHCEGAKLQNKFLSLPKNVNSSCKVGVKGSKFDQEFNSFSANSSLKRNSKVRDSIALQSRSNTHLSSQTSLEEQLNTKLGLLSDTDTKSNTNIQQRSETNKQPKTDSRSPSIVTLHSPSRASGIVHSKTNITTSLLDNQHIPQKSLLSRIETNSYLKNNLTSNIDPHPILKSDLHIPLKNNLELTSKPNLLSPIKTDFTKCDSLPRANTQKKSIPRDKIIRSVSFVEHDAAINREKQLNRESYKSNSGPEAKKITAAEKREKHFLSSDISTFCGLKCKNSEIIRGDRSHSRISNLPNFGLKLNCETSQLSALGKETKKYRHNFGGERSVSPSALKSVRKDFSEVIKTHQEKMSSESGLRNLAHPGHNEFLKNYNSATFKLIKTISEFCGQLSRLHERHSEDLQHLVENFRKKHSELRNERPACPNQLFQAWETLLQEVEVDSQLHSDVAGTFSKQVAKPLIERTFHKKIQSKKIFTQREGFESILNKTEDMLRKNKKEYSDAIQAHYRTQSNASLATYFDAHNTYVEQLHSTNSMLKEYHNCSLPNILQELDDIYADISAIVIESLLQGVETISVTASEQKKRYEMLSVICRGMDPRADTVFLVKYLDPSNVPPRPASQHRFVSPPQQPNSDGEHNEVNQETQLIPRLKNELVMDQLAAVSSRSRLESLRKESGDLERQIACLQEGVDALMRVQQRSLESSLYNKANELQEDIGVKKFEMRAAELHLSAVKAQKELFASKEGNGSDSRDRKMSNSSAGSMKSKWMKAFKSLKSSGTSGTSSSSTSKETERKPVRERGDRSERAEKSERAERSERPERSERGMDTPTLLENSHILQEYTYKKITACDVCQQILRGHSRQGLKCRLCKMNVHSECQERVPRCQPKSRLLRRQRSTSEIESKQMLEVGEDDAPMSPRRRRLNLRMKSISLDSPESTEQRKRQTAAQTGHASSYNPSPSSPVHNRRLLSARAMRMSSVELPDENEKSLSSASTSPCPSPINKKPHRLLPTNLYVVLYNFTSRHSDELDLRAGYKITVIDTSDPDWWQGKCLGRIGYFPSKYVTRLHGGEKPLQVTHNLQVSDGENGIKLLRDQIVIQVGEEIDGMVMIRNGDKQQGVCPLKYLQEV